MSRAKLFNLIKSRGEQKNGRNPFDLTNRHVYTQKAGKICPVKALHTYPDDYFEVSMSEFSQNNIPMNTAAFLAGKKEIIAYFVPYNSIWHNYNQYMATREDPTSSVLQAKGISYEPRMRLFDMYKAALFFCMWKYFFLDYVDILVLNYAMNADVYDLDFDEGMTGSEILAYLKSKPSTFPAPIGTSEYDYLRDYLIRTNRANVPFYLLRNQYDIDFDCFEHARLYEELTMNEVVSDFNGNFVWCDWVRKMDMFGYGNIYPNLHEFLNNLNNLRDSIIENSVIALVDDAYHLQYVKDNETYDLNSSDFTLSNSNNIPLFEDEIDITLQTLKLLSTSQDGDDIQYEYVNLYPIYAYNHIFYSFMRNVYYDNDYHVYNYNCDFINANSFAGSVIDYSNLPLRWYRIESHQWKKDMFTGVLPDNQLGQVSSLILGSGESQTVSLPVDGYGTLDPNNNVVISEPSYGEGNDSRAVLTSASNPMQYSGNVVSSSSMVLSGTTNNYGAMTPLQVRQPHSHQLQRYGDNDDIVVGLNARAVGNIQIGNVELNVLALKRAEAIQQYRQDLMRAGNRTKDIFEQIFGTNPKSEMDETPYFIDVASNDINVNAIIASAETGQEINGKLGDIAARSTISGNALNFKFSTKDFGMIIFLSYIVPESFYNSTRLDPFITHLDQEAHGLPYFQNLGLQPVIRSFLCNENPDADVRNSTVGFAPPYIERKTDIDLVHGNLVDISMVGQDQIDFDYQGSLSHWVVARTDMQMEKTVTLRQFYINPRILDNVFTFEAGDDYETDHYLTYSVINVDSVRAFSQLGLPRF